MAFSYKYKPVKLKSGGFLYRPMIPITCEGLDLFSMLDSGSDLSVISEEIAEELSIQKSEETELYGITGKGVRACVTCGEPSAKNLCRRCELVDELKLKAGGAQASRALA